MKRKDRIIISVLVVWTFIHTYLLLINYKRVFGYRYINVNKLFYPFTKDTYYPNLSSFNLDFYDYSEYFIYVVGAWVGFFIYKFLKGV